LHWYGQQKSTAKINQTNTKKTKYNNILPTYTDAQPTQYPTPRQELFPEIRALTKTNMTGMWRNKA